MDRVCCVHLVTLEHKKSVPFLAESDDPVGQVLLDVGAEDLSSFPHVGHRERLL